MKYLADTGVLSQSTKPQPNSRVAAWLGSVSADDLYLSAITIQEVRAGLESMAQGRKRHGLEHWLEHDLLSGFAKRTLAVDAAVADMCGRLVAASIKQHHTPSLSDALIAATARVHGLRLATLNRRHFERFGVELVEF